jgi:hypothetical protein
VKNTEIFQSDLVVMGNLPRWEIVKVVKISQNDFIVMGHWPRCNIFGGGEKCEEFSKWFHCNGIPA